MLSGGFIGAVFVVASVLLFLREGFVALIRERSGRRRDGARKSVSRRRASR